MWDEGLGDLITFGHAEVGHFVERQATNENLALFAFPASGQTVGLQR